MPSLQDILEHVRRRIVPTAEERQRMAEISEQLTQEVEQILREANLPGKVSLQGSYARDTWLRNDTDLDIFVQFPSSMDRSDWVQRVLPSLRKSLARFKPIERYAEHPFLEFHTGNIRVNVVPCYEVTQGDWKSATDRTPYHTRFMQEHFTEAQRLQARFLKKFAKGIDVYGAEIKTGGFSGMLVDTLTLHYGSFIEALEQASSWRPGTRLELGQAPKIMSPKESEQGVDLFVVDPVDPQRNLAAAVRQNKLWTLVAAARQFLSSPSSKFFFPPEFSKKKRSQISRRIDQDQHELIGVTFNHPVLVADVLWGQLMKLERSLVETIEREDFHVNRSTIWSNENNQSAILLEAEPFELSTPKVHRGPPVSKRDDSQAFLQRHIGVRDTARGPWIERDRWLVEKKRGVSTIGALVTASLKDSTYGLSVPGELGKQFQRSVKVLPGKKIMTMLGRPGFDQAFWQFMEARPSWLTFARK